MSLERAYKNCMRCFHLSGAYQDVLEKNSFNKPNHFGNDKIYSVMNEAMKALEEVRNRDNYPSELAGLAICALGKCVECDFSKANIADYVEKEVKLKDVEKEVKLKK